MEKFVGSIALIRHPDQGEQRWLARWCEQSQRYEFARAERLEGDTFRECIEREIGWTFGLHRGKDYIVSSQSRVHLNVPIQLESDLLQTFYVVELFVADLFGKSALNILDANVLNRWLEPDEILTGKTGDQRDVEPHLVALLNMSNAISRHP